MFLKVSGVPTIYVRQNVLIRDRLLFSNLNSPHRIGLTASLAKATLFVLVIFFSMTPIFFCYICLPTLLKKKNESVLKATAKNPQRCARILPQEPKVSPLFFYFVINISAAPKHLIKHLSGLLFAS